jgi:hypothetical protein
MPMHAEAPCPTVCASAGLHPNHDWERLGDKRHGGSPRQALPQHNVARVIYAYNMENLLGNINFVTLICCTMGLAS